MTFVPPDEKSHPGLPGRSVKHTPTWISNPEAASSARVGLPHLENTSTLVKDSVSDHLGVVDVFASLSEEM